MGRDLNFKRISKEGYMEGTIEGEEEGGCNYAVISKIKAVI